MTSKLIKDMLVLELLGETLKKRMIFIAHVKQTLWLALSNQLYTTSSYDVGTQEGVINKKDI